MSKPLTLNINKIPSIEGFKQNHIISASELLSKYTMKSPINSRICLTDQTHSVNKNMNSPRNNTMTKRKSLKHLQLSCKFQNQDIPFLNENRAKTTTFSKVKNINLQDFGINKQIPQQPQKNIKNNEQQKSIANELRLPLKLVKDTDKNANRSNVTRLIKQIIKMKNKTQKQQKNIKPTTFKRKKCQQYKPLTQRHSQKISLNINHNRTGTFKHNLSSQSEEECLSFVPPRDAQAQNMLRKGSNASTLSLRTKHTISMQHFEDYEQLFPKDSIDSKPSTTRESSKINAIQNLQKVKQKIYQKIYSLDKKLIQQQMPQKIKKPILISLKRKKQVFFQEYQAHRQNQ